MQYRQGDVLIVAKEVPENAVEDNGHDQRIVLAHGEATGHAHAVSARHVIAYLVGMEMYLRVLRESRVRHEEHDEIILPPGDYQVVRQREYTPQAIRRVAD